MGKWVKAGVACLSYQAFTCGVVLSYTIQTQPAAWIAIWLIRAWDDASHLSLGIVKGNISRMRVAVLQLSSGFSLLLQNELLYYFTVALDALCLPR